MTLTLDAIRECLDGAIPGVIATCAPDGTPNVGYVSQIHYLDRHHVALSFQFFNKTHANVRANPHVRLAVKHPVTAAIYAIRAEYLRTEDDGPLFAHMRAKLASIAADTGMSDVFVLRGADVYRVHDIAVLSGAPVVPVAARNPVAALRAIAGRISRHDQLDALLDATLDALFDELDIEHAMVLVWDRARALLYTVASRGYTASGVGAEVPLGAGVIGMAARHLTPIRLTHLAAEYAYARAALRGAEETANLAPGEPAREVPYVGLLAPESQLAVPITSQGALLGVLFVESERARHFGYDDEDALVALAAMLGTAMGRCVDPDETDETVAATPVDTDRDAEGAPVRVRHYPEDDSVFLDGEYLVKGVAGAILWAMLSDRRDTGRVDFTNRELRLDPRLRLPDLSDNLEARLVLLRRRLAERCAFIALDKTGRGRLRLVVSRPIELEQICRSQ